jgi:hypothetical protein
MSLQRSTVPKIVAWAKAVPADAQHEEAEFEHVTCELSRNGGLCSLHVVAIGGGDYTRLVAALQGQGLTLRVTRWNQARARILSHRDVLP